MTVCACVSEPYRALSPRDRSLEQKDRSTSVQYERRLRHLICALSECARRGRHPCGLPSAAHAPRCPRGSRGSAAACCSARRCARTGREIGPSMHNCKV
eukprot:6205121-Pleurochrysis_carterae.AAC.3